MEMQEDVIDLRELLFIIRKHIKSIIIIPVIFAIIGACVSIFLIKPTYESTTTLMVNKDKLAQQGLTMEDINFGRQIIYTYAEIAKSNAVMDKVKSDLNIEENKKLNVSVSPLKDTQILNIKVVSKDPVFAQEVADSVAKNFSHEIVRIAKVDNVQIVDKAQVPEKPIKPNKVLNTIVSGMLGLFLVVGIVFVREMMDNTIKSDKDVQKYLELNVIGMIPKYETGEE